MSWRGHFWTLGPFLRHNLLPPRVPDWQRWETSLEDQLVGTLNLSGRLTAEGASDTIVVIVHGLGGSATSYYARQAALCASRAGIDSLRLNLRGADRGGADYYHAGLTEDLEAALGSTALAGYENILLLGYSLGGNMMLRYLAGKPDARIRAAAAVCSPIDLKPNARAIDRPRGVFYRRHVLAGLKEIYRNVAERREVPLPVRAASRIDTIEQWDEQIIAPRHGFAGAEDYWEQTSACNVLSDIHTPTLFVASERDPMVGIDTLRPWLQNATQLRRIITSQGGHVGFPRKADLGLGVGGTVEEQIIQWLQAPT
ncbi:MAG: alpha/beta fold hydrolase [Deltaproteobacteria bacterium]|nr:alpha/beta fold hydrolase [Deltaproteobacteria bacterium]MBW1875182.1 alpha/beta fold hydrolase [Deltaproteobacteria bacterium]MBW2211856.1 alpha/beta fold hydrolase [Deltaproteobacteria bacterium]MBW2214630.1 alpha/beta fold hydrolase [Deltaproteobacteria bacterium]MBW2380403.1 alpha/beta fold hydrolase [Deltaproteobacteria bacterium]